MKNFFLLTLSALIFSFCPKVYPASPEIHLYTWADYIKPELVARFEKEQNCKVVIDTYDSNEAMYAKIKAGATGYDVATPSSYMAKVMWDQGMLMELNKESLPNTKTVDPEFLKIAIDPNMAYSVPYMFSCVGIGYLSSSVKDFKSSWSIFNRTDMKGRMTLLNDMRETIGAALKTLGFSLNSTNTSELNAARDLILKWKKNIAKFDNEQYKTGLASGEFKVVHGYSGDVLKMKEENDAIEYVLPVEGFSVASDDLVILKTSKNADLAHKFINFLHAADVAAENSEFIAYLAPNTAAYEKLSPEFKNNPVMFPPEEIRAKGEVIKDLGADTKLYTKIWDEIKAGG